MNTIFKCFPQGKNKVLTMSYDDGKISDRRLVEIFNKYGIKGTFNLNSGLFGIDDGFGLRLSDEEIKALYSGHEVAVHTLTHPTLPRCPQEQIVQQVLEDRINLEGIVEYTVRGMAYPNVDGYNDQIKNILPYLGVDYARTNGCTMNFLIPKDYYQWQCTCDHRHDLMKLGQEFVSLYKKQYLYMMSVYGHSIDLEKENCWDLMEQFCSYVSNKDDIWYATNIEIVDYFKAFDKLRFSAKGDFVENPSSSSVWINVNEEVIEIKGGQRAKLNLAT